MQTKFLSEATKSLNPVIFFDEQMSEFVGDQELHKLYQENILSILKNSNRDNKFGEIAILPVIDQAIQNIILVNIGKKDDLDASKLTTLGGKITSCAIARKLEHLSIVCQDFLLESYQNKAAYLHLCFGLELRHYKFDKYFTDRKKKSLPMLVELVVPELNSANQEYQDFVAILSGIELSKNLISEPANVIYPESFAQHCTELAKLGIEVEILNAKQMKELGMNALLGVAQGSAKEARMAVMKWNGGAKEQSPLAFCGKGVTFDSGGLSIKPASGMEEMKYDMAGAAIVTGLIKTLAMRKAKVNVVGVVGLVENMTGSNAQRPGDVVTSMSGQTIEILNTDAEGRLVLADVLWYTQATFNPQFMIDLATLTGAITVALADQYAGLFSNNDVLAEQLTSCGLVTKERVWRLPMGPEYDKMIDSQTADVQNISNKSVGGGSITAAQFLQRFVNGKPWVHLDIAGVTWSKQPSDCHERGATGFGVRLLNQFIRDNYEGS